MSGKFAGALGTAMMLGYVGFLAYKVGAPPLLLIVGATIVMALVDLWQTEFQRREESRRS